MEKVQGLEKDFKCLHDEIIESIDIEEESQLEKEQEILDRQEEINDDLTLRLRVLPLENSAQSDDGVKTAEMRLKRLQAQLQDTKEVLKSLDEHKSITEHCQTFVMQRRSPKSQRRASASKS